MSRALGVDAERAPRSGLRWAVVVSSAGTGAARFAGAVGGLLAARLLGPSGRGQLAVLLLFATTGSIVASAGMQFWTSLRVARTRGILAVRWVLRRHLLVMVVGLATGALVLGSVVATVADVGSATLAATAAFAMTTAVQLVMLALPSGMRSMGVVASATVTASVTYAVGMGALLVLDHPSIGLVLLAGTVGNLLAIGIVVGWTRRAPLGRGPEVRGRAEYGRAFRFGAPAGAGELLLFGMLRVDILILACFVPLREVGLYAVATALTEILWVLPDGIAQVVLPTTGADPSRSRTLQLLVMSLAATAAAGLLLISLDDQLLELAFGPGFRGASAAIPLLVAASLAGGAWKIAGAEVAALGRTSPRATSALVGLLTMVAVDLMAVPSLGIRGAALGSAIGYTSAAMVIGRAWFVMTRPRRAHESSLRSGSPHADVAVTREPAAKSALEVQA